MDNLLEISAELAHRGEHGLAKVALSEWVGESVEVEAAGLDQIVDLVQQLHKIGRVAEKLGYLLNSVTRFGKKIGNPAISAIGKLLGRVEKKQKASKAAAPAKRDLVSVAKEINKLPEAERAQVLALMTEASKQKAASTEVSAFFGWFKKTRRRAPSKPTRAPIDIKGKPFYDPPVHVIAEMKKLLKSYSDTQLQTANVKSLSVAIADAVVLLILQDAGIVYLIPGSKEAKELNAAVTYLAKSIEEELKSLRSEGNVSIRDTLAYNLLFHGQNALGGLHWIMQS